jgi:hypothetical protein
MEPAVFVAWNIKVKLFLRQQEIKDARPRFSSSGEIVKFGSLFAAVEFFKESRFNVDEIELRRYIYTITNSWTFEDSVREQRKFFG